MRVKLSIIHFSVLVSTAFLVVGCGAKEESIYTTYSGFALSEDVVLPKAETHPSLWFSSEEVASLRSKRGADAYAEKLWKDVIQMRFILSKLPAIPSLDDDKTTIHKYYGDLTQIAMYNALLYQLEMDEELKSQYREIAEKALLRGYKGPMYSIDPIVKGTAADEIYQSLWSQNFAAAYDWIQPSLSAESDAIIRGHLSEHAEYIYENLYSWARNPHNHQSKPAWGLGTLALCLSDHPNARKWLHRAVEATNQNTRYYFSSDGIYREGTHYYIFSMINFLPFLYHYKNVSDVNGFKDFKPAFEWPILVRNGKGWMPYQEDSYIRPYPSQLVAKAFRDSSTRLHSFAPLSSILQWNFINTDYAPFEDSEATTGFNYTGASWDYAKELIEFLCYEPDIEPIAPDLNPIVFLESGQTVFRNDWSFKSPKHRYLLFHGVPEGDNHEHFDGLSFILQAENQMMSSDAGYSRRSYGEAIRTEWYKTAEAHNVVMVDGRAPADEIGNDTPESRFRLTSSFFSSEMKTAPYLDKGTLNRTVCFIDNQRFAILDEVNLNGAAEISIVMHGGRAALQTNGLESVWSYSNDRYGPEAKLSQWFFGHDFERELKSGETTYIKGDYQSFPYFTDSKQGKHAFALHILDPGSTDAKSLDLEQPLATESKIVARNSNIMLIANRTGERHTYDEIETDALLCYAQKASKFIQRLAFINGSYLKFGDDLEIDIETRRAIAIEYHTSTGQATLSLDDGSSVKANLILKGNRQSVELDQGTQNLSL